MNLITQISLALFSILPGNYSGITHIRDNQYAIVDDKDDVDGFRVLTLDFDLTTGEVTNASLCETEGMAELRRKGMGIKRDCEGVAYCHETRSVFVASEEDQQIIEYDLNGRPTDRFMEIPDNMLKDRIVKNMGFESLTYNSQQELFWTTTEGTLPADGPTATMKNPQVRNRLRLQSFGLDLEPAKQYAYEMDMPTCKSREGQLVHGVSDMLALDDGRIIIMEREAYIAKNYLGSYCTIKLYAVNPAQGTSISSSTNMKNLPSEAFLKKELVYTTTTHLRMFQMNFANFEGICLGPQLHDGTQTILLISDSQNGTGNSLYRLKDYLRVISITK